MRARPRIAILPLGTTAEGEHVLRFEAVDPDGVILEVAIEFGDGTFGWFLLASDPATTEPGDPTELEITWPYAPGKYTVRAWAYSTPRCFDGDLQGSPTRTRRLRVV